MKTLFKVVGVMFLIIFALYLVVSVSITKTASQKEKELFEEHLKTQELLETAEGTYEVTLKTNSKLSEKYQLLLDEKHTLKIILKDEDELIELFVLDQKNIYNIGFSSENDLNTIEGYLSTKEIFKQKADIILKPAENNQLKGNLDLTLDKETINFKVEAKKLENVGGDNL